MKRVSIFLWAGLLSQGLMFNAFAANTATATVTFSIGSIAEIAVSGNPAPLVLGAAVAGNPPDPVSDSSTTYSVTTNATAQRITGALNADMPANTSLSVTLAPPTGATSTGPVPLTTVPQDLVTGISNVSESGLTITYTLAATAAAAPVVSDTRIVTYTIGP